MSYVVNINFFWSNICSNECFDFVFFEVFKGFLLNVLWFVFVNCGCFDIVLIKYFCDFISVFFSMYKDYGVFNVWIFYDMV